MRPAVSLVVICFEMARELSRTLISLSPKYQELAAAQYEVIVVDNGSREPPRLEDFAGLGLNLRIARCDVSSPSPVAAINQGLALATADLVGVWIDGARMASPGLIRSCVDAARLHPRAVVATLNYQLGFEMQWISGSKGYDQKVEDALVDSIGWPADGYRLFEISTCEVKNAPTGPLLESNALFLSHALWKELKGYDVLFTEPGGGAVNPDTLARALALPGTQLIRIVGEGTFHQFHGGLTTSSQQKAVDTLKVGARNYFKLRRRPLAPVRQVGWIHESKGREKKSAAARKPL